MSPLGLSLNRKTNTETKERPKTKIFNILGLIGILIFLVCYALIINNRIGSNFEIQKLSNRREVLREDVRSQANFINSLKTPTAIQTKINNEMVKVITVNYLKDVKQEVAILKKID